MGAGAGQPKEAAADLRKALELLAKDSAADAEDRFEKSRALALLAKLGADTKSGVSADEAKAFADQAVAALADAAKAGWAQPAELREPDFDAVRAGPTSGSCRPRWGRGPRRSTGGTPPPGPATR